MSIVDLARRAAGIALNPKTGNDQLQLAVRELLENLNGRNREEATEALAALGEGIGATQLESAAFVATACGTLIERGLPGEPVANAFTKRLAEVVAEARGVFDVIVAKLPPGGNRQEQIEEAIERLNATSPAMANALGAIDKLFRPAIALFSASFVARQQAAGLLSLLQPMSPYSRGAHWISKIIQVLHDEPYLAIEPSTGLGIAGQMSGISENFQLHVLLMDVFPSSGSASNQRVAASVASIARGEGPQQIKQSVCGFWNLYTWKAMREDRTLPDAKDFSATENWIWGEGMPADIPLFDGHRVILLGPRAYERGWNAQRDFAALKASLSARRLSPMETKEWLSRLVKAPK